eukprot:2057745-Ditylum_brightwellii.AAC.1
MATSRTSLCITKTQYSHLTRKNFWISWNMEYQCCDIESLLYKGKHKAGNSTPTKSTGKKFYCDMHRCNRTHDTEDCFKVKQHTKRAKPNTSCNKADK